MKKATIENVTDYVNKTLRGLTHIDFEVLRELEDDITIGFEEDFPFQTVDGANHFYEQGVRMKTVVVGFAVENMITLLTFVVEA